MKNRDSPPWSFFTHPDLDFDLEFEGIAKRYGYNVEVFYPTTEDGYINKLFRINKFDQEKLNDKSIKPSVLLLHGLGDSSDTFIVNKDDRSIGFVLANAGYDVWIGNFRGNKHSEGHTTLDAKTDHKYWNNCVPDYMAMYDIPSFIEKVKEISGVKKMAVLTHSMGGNSMFLNLQLNATYYK